MSGERATDERMGGGGETTGLEVAVVGMSGRFPGAPDVETFWRNLREGRDCITVFSDEELLEAGESPEAIRDPAYVRARGVLDGADRFDAAFFGYFPREAQVMDPQQRVFLECAWEALESAGYDPARCSLPVGVFAGASVNDYLALLREDPEVRAAVDPYQLRVANAPDTLATRVSYKLDVSGPSLTVQTACSTSLVAVHLACQSLLSGECAMALAGGVSIRVPQRAGFPYVQGGILSPDGRCRAFDAAAQGTVNSDGVGVLVLKRLEDALTDGDHVHAVILASAVNNDGARKVGFSAPSVEGQARVIRAAHFQAEVDPGSIGYVEAHGTGTALGDPVEVEALTEAFRAGTPRTGFCALGSVKSNIGHTDAAAGVAGLLKAVLALEHAEIPPTLHFERPNPGMRLEGSPFFVAAELRRWERCGTPRRAGVSSFGLGGTNAHLVLEEASRAESSGPSRPWQLLVVSARTPSALDAATERLAAHLERHPELSLADAAHTLRVGRRAFAHRRAVVCSGPAEAAEALRTLDPRRVQEGDEEPRQRDVVFLFPGQGGQHPGMGAGLYESEPVFREAVDRCCELLHPMLGRDLRDPLYRGGPGALDTLTLSLPALFATEYALARLWTAWGVKPAAMIGHSMGEYVAACLAGVLSLEDALRLVVARAGLLDSVPEGAMLAVPLPEAEVRALLGPALDLALVNGPAACVVSGTVPAVDALRASLQQAGVECRRVRIDRAAHSHMLDPVLDAFRAECRRIRFAPPSIPYVSNLTGTWITAQQAADPEYWVRHLRETVRFADGVRTLLEDGSRLFLEVGPGRALAGMVRQGGGEREPWTAPSLRHPSEAVPDLPFLLGTLCRLWCAGVPVDWEGFTAGERRRRVPLPTYPFEGGRFWVGRAATDQPTPARRARPAAASGGELEERLLEIWRGVFGIQRIGRHDNFYDLGGHSLLATGLASRLRAEFGVDLPLRTLLESPTVADLARAIVAARGGAAPARPDATHRPHPDAVLDPAIVPGVPAAPVLPPREALVTGVTGYLGAFLLHELLGETGVRAHCLVRARDAAEGMARIRDSLRTHGLWDGRWESRIVPVPGDLSRPLLGLGEAEFDALAARLDAVYHCGAHVHFTLPYAALRDANVDGTREVLRLAARRHVKPVHHVSTLAVFTPGAYDGGHVAEDDPLGPWEGNSTGYGESKWVAEALVEAARERGIPVAVYRPGAVLGPSGSAASRTDDFFWRMLKGCVQLGAAPEVDHWVYGAPADFVARAIVHLSLRPDTPGRVFHVVHPDPIRWDEIWEHVRLRGYSLERLPYPEWRARLLAAAGEEGGNELYPVLHLLGPEVPVPSTFGTENTFAGLGEGAKPPLDAALFRRYLEHLVDTGFLPPVPGPHHDYAPEAPALAGAGPDLGPAAPPGPAIQPYTP